MNKIIYYRIDRRESIFSLSLKELKEKQNELEKNSESINSPLEFHRAPEGTFKCEGTSIEYSISRGLNIQSCWMFLDKLSVHLEYIHLDMI